MGLPPGKAPKANPKTLGPGVSETVPTQRNLYLNKRPNSSPNKTFPASLKPDNAPQSMLATPNRGRTNWIARATIGVVGQTRWHNECQLQASGCPMSRGNRRLMRPGFLENSRCRCTHESNSKTLLIDDANSWLALRLLCVREHAAYTNKRSRACRGLVA